MYLIKKFLNNYKKNYIPEHLNLYNIKTHAMGHMFQIILVNPVRFIISSIFHFILALFCEYFNLKATLNLIITVPITILFQILINKLKLGMKN